MLALLKMALLSTHKDIDQEHGQADEQGGQSQDHACSLLLVLPLRNGSDVTYS